MTIAAADLIERAGNILQDEDHVRWEVPELLQWINDGAGEVIVRRPGARSVTKVIPLNEGTLQAIPAEGVQLLDVVRNMGTDGQTPGRIVRRVDRQLLDDQDPDWHTTRKTPAIRHYTFDDRAPKEFYVYPPSKAGAHAEVLYSELPPKVVSEADTLDLGAEYMAPLVSYIGYRAFSKDSEYANGQVASLHFQAFIEAVTGTSQNAIVNSPNQNSV